VAEVQRADSEVPEDAASLVGSVSLAARLSTAQTLWVKTGKLYGNLGNGLGNQLDMPRGTRIFFGCDADEVPRNTLLRHVSIQVPGFGAERRSIRFANNSMDKINLPRPGTNGPENYDDSYLIFDRSGVDADGVPSYKLTVTDLDGLEQRKASAIDWLDMEMSGGRPYGLMDFSGA
jgi:hypothetical protein